MSNAATFMRDLSDKAIAGMNYATEKKGEACEMTHAGEVKCIWMLAYTRNSARKHEREIWMLNGRQISAENLRKALSA